MNVALGFEALGLRLSAFGLLAMVGAAPVSNGTSPDVPTIAAHADSLYFANDPAGSFAACSIAFSKGVDDSRLRWRAARAAIALGMLTSDIEVRTAHYDAALAQARRGLALSPYGKDERYWVAAAAGRRARKDQLFLGIRLANLVLEHSAAILAVDSMHAGAHHALGMLHAAAIRIPKPARLLASHVLGLDVAQRASFEEAEQHMRRAAELAPEMVVYLVDLAHLYGRAGKVPERTRTMAQLARTPDLHPADAFFRDSCVRVWQ